MFKTNRVSAALLAAMLAVPIAAQAEPVKRFFAVAAVEPKGGTTIDKEAFPDAALLPTGGGYVLKKPDATGRWEVSTYMWMPNQIIVNQGDEVTIDFVGINGATHAAVLKGYDKQFVVKRGQTTRVSFTADRTGVFPIDCANHRPSMVAEVVVLPAR